MTKITEELLRKRSEHNEGQLSTLKEITLHQYEIEKIELVGTLCRELQILFLQNNLISKIENLQHLKDLRYLNLAVNNITVIENLESNEFLEKLDLTCNFVSDLTCVENLKDNYNLKELYLMGNPCTTAEYYRPFVVATLPQLTTLDGQDITRSERIAALQELPSIRQRLLEAQSQVPQQSNASEVESTSTVSAEGERLYGNTPEERLAAHRDIEARRRAAGKNEDRSTVDGSKIGELERIGSEDPLKRERLTAQQEVEKYGRVMQKNEGRWNFKLYENEQTNSIVLDIPVGKYLDTSLIDIDVQPTYVRVTAKGKVLQLLLPEEVRSSDATAQRSQTTGVLKLVMPKVSANLQLKPKSGSSGQSKPATAKPAVRPPSHSNDGEFLMREVATRKLHQNVS